MYNKILITLITVMLPSAAMCVKSPEEQEEELRQQQEKRKLLKQKKKDKKQKAIARRLNEKKEIEEARRLGAENAEEKIKQNMISEAIKLQKLSRVQQELLQAKQLLLQGFSIEERGSMRHISGDRQDLVDEIKKYSDQKREDFIQKYGNEVRKEGVLIYPMMSDAACTTEEEKRDFDKISKIHISPFDIRRGGDLDTFDRIRNYYYL